MIVDTFIELNPDMLKSNITFPPSDNDKSSRWISYQMTCFYGHIDSIKINTFNGFRFNEKLPTTPDLHIGTQF